MQFDCPYWSIKVRMDLLARWILVHSCLYYELNASVIDDHKYDMNEQQLTKLVKQYPQEWKRCRYYYAMKEFDGSTGFGFYQKLHHEHAGAVLRDAMYLKEHVKYQIRSTTSDME